jgi:MFS transporter, DHA1 family, inner membrane transport protein
MGGQAFDKAEGIPSNLTVAALLAIICIVLLVLGVQPLVLGALNGAGRLSVPEMGWAATAEMLALGGASALMAARVRPRGLKVWALAGCAVMAAADFTGLGLHGLPLVLSRAVTGAGGGILLWLATAILAARPDYPRINALSIGGQAVSQAVLAALIPVLVLPAMGAGGPLVVFGGGALVSVLLLPLVPGTAKMAAPEVAQPGAGRMPRLPLGLATAFLVMAGVVGLWVYVEPIAQRHHIAEQQVSLAVSLSLGAQVVGSIFVFAAEKWVRPFVAMVVVLLLDLAILAAIDLSASSTVFFAAIVVFGFNWTLSLAYFLPLLLAEDPSRRAVLYLPAANLLGSSAGPTLAGLFASDTDILPALVMVAAIFVAALGLLLAMRRRLRGAAIATETDNGLEQLIIRG